MKKVALLLIATGKYDIFLQRLLKSIDSYFLKDCEVDVHLFTDKIEESGKVIGEHITPHLFKCIHKIDHKPFPYSTLYRFHFFDHYKHELTNEGYDYYFYLDVDTEIKSEINSEILSERTAVQHCGFVNRPGPFETKVTSQCYVHHSLRLKPYFGGGFWGFSSEQFWQFVENAVYMIWQDERNGIVPVWHDESVLNKYLIMKAPTKILSPSYHYPEGNIERYKAMWPENYECKILLLDKNHEELRS